MATIDVAAHAAGVLAGDRATLARAITLIESQAARHFEPAQALLTSLLGATGRSLRVGITGVPGAGKSTLIEKLGLHLIEQGHRVAVLAIDPSSNRSGGSILGDKTRMTELARHPAAFVRPSPTSGALGGVGRKTRESILLCEAAGYDVILVETVGTGQSEVTVRSMVDFFLLLLITGAGDELQGIKKGVMELADAVVINKADGENLLAARTARAATAQALHYLTPATAGWQTPVLTCSGLTGAGIATIWETVTKYADQTRANSQFEARRAAQRQTWFEALVAEQLQQQFYQRSDVKAALPGLQAAIAAGTLPPAAAAAQLVALLQRE